MEDKENQIEELAKDLKDLAGIIRDVLVNKTDIGYIPDLAFPIAKEVLKQYQPKLPEDSVVLTQKEFKLLSDIKKKFETADGDEITAVSLLIWLKELTAKEREETAEKIKDMAKQKSFPTWLNVDENPRKADLILLSDLNEITKQFSVEENKWNSF